MRNNPFLIPFVGLLTALAFVASCSGTKAPNPKPPARFRVEVGPNFNSSLTQIQVCAAQLAFVPSDGGDQVLATLPLSDLALSSSSTALASVEVPDELYDRVEISLSSGCASSKSVELSNASGQLSSADPIVLKFSGRFRATSGLSILTLEAQRILDALAQVTAGSQIKASAESAHGSMAPWTESSAGIRYVSSVLSDSPLVYYRFEDTAYYGWDQSNPMSDSSGNSRHGAYGGVLARPEQPGAPIGSRNFSNSFGLAGCCSNGVGYAYGAGGLLDFNDATGDLPFTVEAWVRNTQAGGKDGISPQPIFSRFHNNNGRAYLFGLDSSNRLSMSLHNSGNTASISRISSVTLDVDTWYHVAVTYDGSRTASGIRLYLNGARVDTQDASFGAYAGMTTGLGGVPMIGATWDYNWFWLGNIDELAVYDSELPASRISGHYDSRQ